jgi:hypothetical protein
MLEAIEWDGDQRFTVNGYRFQFVDRAVARGTAEPARDAFNVYKTRPMLDDYEHVLAGVEPVDTIAEVGVFQGGSAALFAELLDPRVLIAFDIQTESPSTYFDEYVAASDVLYPNWGVDQADQPRLVAAVDRAGADPLDVVIDDASHDYDLSVLTFNALFPRIRAGGLYLIEDWGWAFHEVMAESETFRCRRSLSDIVQDLAGLMAVRPGAIARVTVYPSFVAVHRGTAAIGEMSLATEPYRRSNPVRNRRVRAARHIASRLVSVPRRLIGQ